MNGTGDWEDVYNEPLPRTIEDPITGKDWLLEDPYNRVEPWQPDTELQAMMETEPGGHQQTSKEELANTSSWYDDILNAMDALTEEERAVIEVTVIAGHSIRKAAEILGMPKSTVYRIKKSALNIIKREIWF